jgi:hypothetical protein
MTQTKPFPATPSKLKKRPPKPQQNTPGGKKMGKRGRGKALRQLFII